MSNNVANAQSFEQQGDRPSFALEKEANATGTAPEFAEKCHRRGIDRSDKYHGMFAPPLLAGQKLTREEHLVFNYIVDGVAINAIAMKLRISVHGATCLRISVLEKCGCSDVVELLHELLIAERAKVVGRTAIAIVGEVG